MPVKPDSRFAHRPLLSVRGPDGLPRTVLALDLGSRTLPAQGRRHRLVAGEALDLLAHRYFGEEGLWWRILDANPLCYPLDLAPGDELNIPEPGGATRITRARSF